MELSKELTKEVVDLRREFHKIPESGFNEYKTSDFIKEKLGEYGYEIRKIAKTGVLALKKGALNKPAIAFRADMDGLHIKEENEISYKSQNHGMMHACGHDGHMAILLGIAKYLSDKNVNRDIVFIFQPAEEGPGGAEVIVKEGILEKYNIKNIFGLHIWPNIEEGKVGLRSGAMLAQTGELDVCIKAKSGHGAVPHSAIDGIYVASQLISSYQSIISRNIDPIEGAVITIGKINGGEARNIIAEDIKLEGTIRTFDIEVYETIKQRLEQINKGIEEMFGVLVSMDIRDMYPPVINDKELFDMMKEILKDEMIEIKPVMIAEDFSYYQQNIPGVFFLLGSKNEDLGYVNPLHSSKFNFNEEVLLHGLNVYINICKKLNII